MRREGCDCVGENFQAAGVQHDIMIDDHGVLVLGLVELEVASAAAPAVGFAAGAGANRGLSLGGFAVA